MVWEEAEATRGGNKINLWFFHLKFGYGHLGNLGNLRGKVNKWKCQEGGNKINLLFFYLKFGYGHLGNLRDLQGKVTKWKFHLPYRDKSSHLWYEKKQRQPRKGGNKTSHLNRTMSRERRTLPVSIFLSWSELMESLSYSCWICEYLGWTCIVQGNAGHFQLAYSWVGQS